MPSPLVVAIAVLQDAIDWLSSAVNSCRRRWLVPLVLRGGRDVFLIGGSWIDYESLQAETKYDCVSHQVVKGTGPIERWKWVTATTTDVDMSEFFGCLRISKGAELTDKEAVLLFISQKGKVPSGVLTVMARNGIHSVIDVGL